MRLLRALLLASSALCSVLGQSYTISTFAGALPENIPGASAGLSTAGVTVDSAGNVFMTTAFLYQLVLKLDAASGMLIPVGGNGTFGFSGDNGPATSSQLALPRGLAIDSVGNIYVADVNNGRIRKIANGVITTVAGNGRTGSSGDGGLATAAQLSNPAAVAVDAAGNLYIADTGNNNIRKVSNGVITTVAGNGTPGFSGDGGQAASAQLSKPGGVAADATGNLYIADTGNNSIRKVSNGMITTVAGSGMQGFSGDGGPATSAQLNGPVGVAVDGVNNLYIADAGNNRIRKVSNGILNTIAGGGTSGLGDGGPATAAQVIQIGGVAVDGAGNLYIASNIGIRKVSNSIITTVAGNGTLAFSGDNGPATSAQMYYPSGVAKDGAGNVYIADYDNSRIRKVSNGVITTVAGGSVAGFSGDNGPASSAQLRSPSDVALDSSGNLYIADLNNNRVRRISNGVITTVAGNGTLGFSGDGGPATGAELANPTGVAVDSSGSLYIADYANQCVRKVSNGVITTVAGNGTFGFSGDGGPATSAQLAGPTGVAVDHAGNLYIADVFNSRIRKVSNGIITTVAGNGTQGFSGDGGQATAAELDQASEVAVDAAGDLYISDHVNSSIRKVSNSVITTVAGNGSEGFSGDGGPATSAQLDFPRGLTVDSAGNVYVADQNNNRIRLLTPSITAPSLSVTAINNAASNLSGPISPGEIVTIIGSGLGPAQLTSAHPATDGVYGPQLSNTGVQFSGIAAPMIYTSSTQIAAIVPYAITGNSVQVTVTYQGQTSAPLQMNVGASAPALFTLDSTGKGQAAAVNQDGSTNTPSTPAHIGDVISLFATGEGQTSPPGTDGKPATKPFPTPNLPVNVTLGGLTVNNLQYVGGAPGEVAGLLQINVPIPAGITPGSAVPIVIRVGSTTSQTGVTVAIAGN